MAYSDREGIPANIENKDKLRNSADLLPMYFRTEANKKFLGSTIDSLISKGNLTRLNGFVGERNTNNAKPTDVYIEEPTDNRRRYNFLPSAVTKNPVNNANKWSGTYDDLINQINFFGGNTTNHSRLFESEYYAWNPLFDFDKFVNYRQYYWLTAGPSPVQVSGNPGTTSTTLLPSTSFIVFDKESNVSSLSGYTNGQLFYFYDSREDVVKRYNSTTGTLELEPTIYARAGRDNMRFQYMHNAENDRRLDPGKSNIIDMYVLTRAYDEDYRIFVNGFGNEPVKPSTEDLKNELDTVLQGVKSISDEINPFVFVS